MPDFEITGPDGKKWVVSGDNAEGAYQAFQKHLSSGAAQGAGSQPAATNPDTGTQKVDASTVYVDEMLFGLPGKASAALNAAIRSPFTDKTFGEEYDTIRNQYNNARERYAEENPVTNAAASIGGAIHGGGAVNAIAGRAITQAAPRAAQALQSTYAGRMAGDAASGIAQGAASAYGHDENVGVGATIGGVVGGLARPVMSAGGAVLDSAGGLVGLGNAGRANRAIAEAVSRSGQTRDDVQDALFRAAQDGQTEFTVADALGNSGQRMLTGIVRSPGDMRQTITETLQRRQAGQGRRLQNALVEGFGTPQTKAQTETALTALRKADAGTNYTAARQGAGAVNPSNAITRADEFLGTGGSLPLTNISDDSVEGAVRRARSLLTDGENVVSDFDTAFRAKVELDNMIENASPTIQGRLIPIRNELDKALEKSSDVYANARDTFRRQSQDIEAANIGRDAAMRGRVEDTVPRFQSMQRPEQQASFRAGYVDPYIEDLQKTAGPATNRARPLITDATGVEFPAFAAPGRGQQMQDRIGREQRMFETYNAALGGSKTADNAADQLDVQSFDPTMFGMVMSGNFPGAALRGLQNGINTIQGRNSQTRDLAARILLGTNGNGTAAFHQALDAAQTNESLRERILRAMISGTATAPQSLAN
ncbi:hypothetical protein [Aliirhizobium cellulosilyticum]|uniref:Uncharacterized protein n=1 Tax=Aliirhizobium cellulosilyticum TaxID=393664 RepID=A0A7W6Y053_9HYPH|nr:hypothetical protein [Rhizobium cellulosilyticum]MBB4347941.1 hypothetical protein [Rhizobium cellulosilyticum]MBB4409665.1 hypothetical protein [Rhizobium cellulosilyticum]MBB4444352.1 hypothetical protein [Rhizobium cellulosilyticum]